MKYKTLNIVFYFFLVIFISWIYIQMDKKIKVEMEPVYIASQDLAIKEEINILNILLNDDTVSEEKKISIRERIEQLKN